ncbi:6-bladed beta-propeller [Rhodohalobacter sp. SW132]|uniref:6-bladed beta-propeller n=1 Tax=Rhodohalobacter sp. SW132 TaxID=2293433 RepID=UPI000E24E879|nr:6-bladed beta-propeller [Rhodohalobacter sp. SW132]REL37788.1 6-bladed beta-propeller [Rhodohalobacter sp. SW132]
MMYCRYILFALLVLFISCSSEPENDPAVDGAPPDLQNVIVIEKNSSPESTITFIRDLVIDDSDATGSWYHSTSGGFAFGGSDFFAGLEVDDTGKIYVGDNYEKVIHVFDSTGAYLRRLGGEGRGPGEFEGIFDIKIHSDQLFAFDYFQFRSTFFSLDSLDVIDVRNVYTNRAPDREELRGLPSRPVSLISDDLFIVRYKDEMKNANYGTEHYNLDQELLVRYYVVDREGKIRSEMIDELKDMENITAVVDGNHLFNLSPVPFLQQPMISISNEGTIFTANSEDPLVKLHNKNGDYIRAFYIPMEKKSIDREEIIDLIAQDDEINTNLLLHAELPEKWPALSDIVTDDENRLWVATIPKSEELIHEWWVLQDTGELIATFKWPGNRSIEKIKNDYVYARETMETTGQQRVVRYRIEME